MDGLALTVFKRNVYNTEVMLAELARHPFEAHLHTPVLRTEAPHQLVRRALAAAVAVIA
mgnify:CR=1 FL=1